MFKIRVSFSTIGVKIDKDKDEDLYLQLENKNAICCPLVVNYSKGNHPAFSC